MSKVVLSLSGGMDSTTLLSMLLDEGHEVQPYQFIYGSKHNKWEYESVQKIAKHFGLVVPLIDLTTSFINIKSALLQGGPPIPEGHYNDKSMSQTVVPGRNSVFISVLSGIAESIGAGRVALGVHSGDHHIYPDCRPYFIKAMRDAIFLSSDGKVSLWAPFLIIDKTSIVDLGLMLKTPYHLTRTCYKDQPTSCGKCGSCQERLEAFRNNGVEDPVKYEFGGTQ